MTRTAAALARARWPELPERPLVLVPIGSTEQHGPHLPFGTDSTVAEAVAGAAAERLDAVLAPTLPYGSSGEHQAFPGTVSIGQEALELVVTELVRSLSTWAGRTVLVNGHGGNAPVLARVVPRLRREGHALGWVACAPPGSDAHAGRAETALLLLLEPDAVRESLAAPGSATPLAELLPRLRAEGVRAVSPNGVLGDPRGASAEEGAAALAAMVDDAVARIRADRPDAAGLLAAVAP